MNEHEYLKAARHLAHELLADRSLEPTDRLAVAYETITAKLPDAEETGILLKTLDDLEKMYGNSDLADELCDGVQLHSEVSAQELAAWTMLVSSIYNLDITKNRD
jgi:hypothetical protein